MQYNVFILIRVCPPILMFAFDDELFKFQFDKPAFDLLFQFPPTMASAHLITLSIYTPNLGGGPPNPLKSGFKKPPTDRDVRIRRRVAQAPVRQTSSRPVIPGPADKGNSLTAILIIIITIKFIIVSAGHTYR